MAHRVVFAPEALDDLRDLYDRIADASLPDRPLTYVEWLRRHCLGLANFPERGTRRDGIRPGMPPIAAAGERAGLRFLEFFAATIRSSYTRCAYARAASKLFEWF